MNIFNSLGSNYNLSFVIKSFFAQNNTKKTKKLITFLEEKYEGKVTLLYKGREALEYGLKILSLPKDSVVAINGFTCYAVYKAIKNANLKVEYLDIPEGDLNFTPETLKLALKKYPQIKVLVVQNTLGYPCQIEEIQKICQQENIILIEDLAHSIGTKYANSTESGKIGDLTILSFSQDKIIDSVSGGALIVRNKKYQNINDQISLANLNYKQQLIDRFYPAITYKIRLTYPFFGLGKFIHFVSKKLNLLSKPMAGGDALHTLPDWYSMLALTAFQNLDKNLSHRQQIASIYAQNINPKLLSEKITSNIKNSSNLRFPIFLENRLDLINFLKISGIYISDIWYDAPIAPKKYLSLTDYQNNCPNSEKISTQILNLPTHQNVSKKDALTISDRINLWLKSK